MTDADSTRPGIDDPQPVDPTDSPRPGNPGLWKNLRNDPAFILASGVFAASLIPFVVPILGTGSLETYSTYYLDLIELAAVAFALSFRAPGGRQVARSQFWLFVTLHLVSLASVRLSYLLVPDGWWDSNWGVVSGSIYLVSYLMLVLAVQANKRVGYQDVVPTTGAAGLRMAGATVFLFGLFVYFVVIPESYGTNSDPWVPSFYIYMGLDLYLLLAFATSRLAVGGHWRFVYRAFAAWAGLTLVADVLEFAMRTGMIAETNYGHPSDVVWMLPYAALIVAVRARHYNDDPGIEALRREPPGWAEPLRAIWQRPLVGYAFTFPLVHFVLHGLGLVNPGLRGPRETLVSIMLVVLGGMALAYQKGLERQKREADEAVQRYVQLENLIAEMSTHFIGLDPSAIDDGITTALRRLGEFAGVDRSFVFRFRDNDTVAECINEWCAEGISPEIDNLRETPVSEFPWIFSELLDGEVVHIPRVSALPPDATPISREATRSGVVSLINVPMMTSSGVVGFIGFDSVRGEKEWSDQSINLLRLVGEMFVNVLQRKRAAEERLALEAQLRQSQRVEALGTLAGGIAHDLNNMLQPIIGYAELARDQLDESSPVWEHIDEVHRAATRARGLTRQILDFSRQDYGGELSPVALADISGEALKLLRMALPSSVEFDERISVPDLFAKGDAGQIHQVLLNLGSNAGDAMRLSGGTLRVELDAVDVATARLAHLGRLAPGRYARISVEDTGTGIDQETLRRVFDPFFTTKDKGRGTGLGLTAVWKIVESHRGAIDITSDPGSGTLVEVFLPACDAIDEAGGADTPQDVSGDERVLFVDDEAEIRDLGARLLQLRGYRVETSGDGQEAIDRFRAAPEDYDIVITDLSMPRLNGIELARGVRSIRPEIPVILATGFMESLTDEVVTDLKVDNVIFKPYKAEEMRSAVRRALDRARVAAPERVDHVAP